MTALIIITSVLVLYIVNIWLIYGTLPSISHSYYELPEKYRFLFTLFCWGYALPTTILAFNLGSWYLLFAGIAICFTGAAPMFKSDHQKWVHIISAHIAIILSQLAILLDFNMWYLNIIFLLGYGLMMYCKKDIKETFWIELLALGQILMVLWTVI